MVGWGGRRYLLSRVGGRGVGWGRLGHTHLSACQGLALRSSHFVPVPAGPGLTLRSSALRAVTLSRAMHFVHAGMLSPYVSTAPRSVVGHPAPNSRATVVGHHLLSSYVW